MTNQVGEDARTDAAITWFVTLLECDDEDVWIAHRGWLEADPANPAAYARVEESWIAVEDVDPREVSEPDPQGRQEKPSAQVIDLAEARETRAARGRGWVWGPLAAAAACVAGILAWPVAMQPTGPLGIAYVTDAAQVRDITLTDGSRVTLNHDTAMVARIDGNARTITLASGEAAFDVRHDAARPFAIAVAGREVRVLGTAFGVSARNGAFGVSVSRGSVSVSAADDHGRIVVLPAGRALSRLRGATQDRIIDIAPANAVAWKTGELVYTSATLSAVAHDYERMIGQPVVVDPSVSNLSIAGVLHVHDEDELVRQIELILPVKVVHTPSGRRIMARSVG